MNRMQKCVCACVYVCVCVCVRARGWWLGSKRTSVGWIRRCDSRDSFWYKVKDFCVGVRIKLSVGQGFLSKQGFGLGTYERAFSN